MRTTKMLALLLVGVLALAACTSDDTSSSSEEDPAGGGADTGAAGGGASEVAAGGASDDASAEPSDAGGESGSSSGGGDLLSEVTSRGTLVCGVNDAVPGFGFTGEGGEFSGFDIDFCKVIAAAVIGDAEAVEYRPLTAEQRFTALQSGEIDVLVRNSTFTASRDGTEGGTFSTTTFYDGQGMMVRSDSGITDLTGLEGASICVLSGTTTELNLASEFGAQGISYEPIPFEDNDTLQQAFEQGRCQGWTSDKSQLAGVRSTFPDGPDALTILDTIFSKEPLGPATRDGDDAWSQAVNWAVIATIQAEEFGITQANVQDMTTSDDPSITSFLGQPSEDGTTVDVGLGLPIDFALQIVEQVGNYGEIYDRNVGPDTPLGLERGQNALWTDGGLHYAPPYR